MSLLGKLRKYLNKDVAILIYKSMPLPFFDHADVIFHKANVKETRTLQTLQSKCLRIYLGKDRRFNTDICHKLAGTPFLKKQKGIPF